MRKALILVAIACLIAALTAPAAMAKMTIKFGHVAPPFHGQSKGVEAFAEYVAKHTNGEIEIKTFPFGQLGSERSMAEQVQAGTLEMASITTAVLGNFAPEVQVMDLPFIFPNRATAYAVIDDEAWQDKIFSYLKPKGFVGIGWTENEFRDITNTKHPIRKPEDLKGIKIRVMNSPVYMDTFKQLGASPVGIPFPELYNALQQGVIDAQENPFYTSALIKAFEVCKYATETDHILTECIIIVGADFWDRLSDQQKKVFKEAAKVCIKTNREVTSAQHSMLPKINMSVADLMKKEGVQVVELTPEERAAFAKAMKPVWDKYKKVVGPELFDFFVAKIKEHSK